MKNRRIQTGNISRLVLLGLLVFSWAFISACSSEKKWKDYQKAYAQKAAELGSKAPQKPSGVRVLEVAELGIQDRCTSCHVAMDDLTMLKEENPLKSHPASYLKEHPPARFGCTICHGGQGDSLSPEKAHGGTFSKGGLIQISCAKCHGEVVLEGAGNVNRGKLLLKRYQCINCHLIADLPEGEDFRPAPSLKGIGDKVGEKWLWRWLKEPKSYLPNATMPHYPMEEKYMDALVGYLMGSKNPRLKAEIQYPEGDSERGVGTLRLSFCSACHSFKGKGGQDGPDLGKIGNKVNQKWLTQMLADPHAFQPDTTMPRYNYTPQQISDVAAHLFEEFADFEMQEKDNAFKQPLFWKSPGERAEIGRRVYKEMRCANCHGILEEDGWWRKIGPDLTRIGEKPVSDINFGNSQVPRTLPEFLFEKIRDPQAFATPTHLSKMPKYDFSEHEIRDIVLALLSQKSDKVSAKGYRYTPARHERYEPAGEFGRLVDKFRCFSCHSFKGRGYNTTYDLTVEGSRVDSKWLFNYLKAPYTLRPMLTIRMPIFNMTDQEARILTRGFMQEMVDPEIEKDLEHRLTSEMAAEGQKLLEEKGCLACHQLGDRGGYVGPSFTQGAFAGEKLRAGWIYKWLINSEKMKPVFLMPNYGLTDQEALLVTAYLMSIKGPDRSK